MEEELLEVVESEDGPPRGGILIIDDDPASRLLLKEILAHFTIARVSEATDGMKGLKTACEVRPDIIFLDYRMPGMSGLDVLRDLLSGPEFIDVPIVMISGRIDPADVKWAAALGAVGCLAKPLSYQQIDNRVGDILRGLSLD